MAYDSESAVHIAALKAEIENDPIGMGYGEVNDFPSAIVNQLNNSALNVGNETINKPVEELNIQQIAGVINPTEYAALDEYDKEWVKMFIAQENNAVIRPFQAKFQAIFAASTTLADTLALRVKDASRAEFLWGVNSVITLQDIDNARDSA